VSSLASRIGYQEVREYLKHRGWVSVPSRRSHVAIFRSPGDGKFEVLVPLERELADYSDAMETIARRAGEFEGRSASAVLHDFLQPRRDIVRFALDGQATADGTIGLLDGLGMLSGAKKSLLASACSAKRPAKFHARMALAEADAFVHGCHLGQTEIGSFVLTVETPHDTGSAVVVGSSFGRRATEYLFASVGRLADAIRQDTVPFLLEAETGAIVSANLCEALVELMPKDESADLRLSSTWSPLLPQNKDIPSVVRIDRDMYESIEEIGQKLRPSDAPLPATFIGFVTELAGGFLPEGEVKLRVIVDEEMLEARAFLTRIDYQTAAQAHLTEQAVSVHGVLHRGRRAHHIKDVTSFAVLDLSAPAS
jgi:hypothetical protein